MAEFLVELYVPRSEGEAVEEGASRARRAAEVLTLEGTPVQFLRSIFVPEDETCFFLYKAASSDAVRTAAQRAALRYERVVETVAQPREEPS